LNWPDGIGLGSESMLLIEVSGLILSDTNLSGLIYLLQKKKTNEKKTFLAHEKTFSYIKK